MTELIKKHYRTTKFKSFVRQLHLYRFFRLKNKQEICFRNFYFHRGEIENLTKVKRKKCLNITVKDLKNKKMELENDKYKLQLERLERRNLELQQKNKRVIDELKLQHELLCERIKMEKLKNQWYKRNLVEALNAGLKVIKQVELC